MPTSFPRNPNYKNTPVPRSTIRNYTIKNNYRRPTNFLATNTNATRRMKIKDNRKNVEEQNLVRRVQVMVKNARKIKNAIPFDSYIKILNATKISDLASIGINTTSKEDTLKKYKILVLNELFTLFMVIIGEILNFTVNGDLKELKDKIDNPSLLQIQQGRNNARTIQNTNPVISRTIFELFFSPYSGGSRSVKGGAGLELVVLGFGAAIAIVIASSPFIIGFQIYVNYNNKKQEINFMQLLLITYKTFFSSNAAIQYKDEINYYKLNQEQKDFFYEKADTFRYADINNKIDTADFRNFLIEFINLKLREVALRINTQPDPKPEVRNFPTDPPVRSFLPPLRSTSLGPAPGIRPPMPPARNTISTEVRSPTVKEILAFYENKLKEQLDMNAAYSKAKYDRHMVISDD